MAINTTNANSSLVPIALTNGKVEPTNLNRVGYPGELVNVDGTVYFQGSQQKGAELYKFDTNDRPVLVGEINTTSNGSQLGTFTNVKGILYFAANDGTTAGFYRIDPTTGLPSRLGDAIISNGRIDATANIVNISNYE